jgi:hypothetical protein
MREINVIIKEAPPHGRGVFSTQKLRRGERAFLFATTIREIKHHSGCHCAICKRCIQIGPTDWLYPDKESFGWYLNHSCEPNCGLKGSFVVAMRSILPGEEITIDYSTTNTDALWRMKCLCGKASCRRIIQSVQHLEPVLFSRYRGWMPPYVEKAYPAAPGKQNVADSTRGTTTPSKSVE